MTHAISTDARNSTFNSIGRDQVNLIFIGLPLANPESISETPNSSPPPTPRFRSQGPAAQSARKPKQSEDLSNLIDNTLVISPFVLDTLQRASQITAVPFLQMAASMALSIVKQAQNASTDDDFRRLAKDACDPVYAAVIAHEARESSRSQTSKDFDNNLENLIKTLISINEYAREKARRSSVERFLMSKSETTKTNEYRQRLSHALNTFWMQSNTRVREQLVNIDVQQGTIPVYYNSHSQDDHLTCRRIGADNSRVADSFDMADMGNTTHIQVTGDIASGNTDLTRAFNEAQMGNVISLGVEEPSADQTVPITFISSNNHDLCDAFQGAVVGNTSTTQPSAFIASGNKNMSRCFNGARMGNTIRHDT